MYILQSTKEHNLQFVTYKLSYSVKLSPEMIF